MRILIVSNLYPPDVIGGYELGCKLIADALAGRGHDVTVATSEVRNPRHSVCRSVAPEGHAVRVRRIFLPQWEYESLDTFDSRPSYRAAKLQRQTVCDLAAAMALHQLIEEEKFDVIYAFNLFGIGLLGLLETLLTAGVAVVVHLMDDFDAFVLNIVKSPGLLARFGLLKKQITAIACSEGTRKRNIRLGPFRAEHVIYSGIPMGSFPMRSKKKAEDGRNIFRIVYSGQVIESKGLRPLVAAFRRMASEQPECRLELHIIGAYPKGFDQELMNIGGDGELEGEIIFYGYKAREELLHILSGMDLGVYPLSPAEAFGYAPMECLACGVPAVITEGGGFWEILPKEYPLTLSNREAIDELVELMTRGMKDGEAVDFAIECFELVRSKYDFEKYGLAAIEEVLKAARCPVGVWDYQQLLQRYRVFRDYSLAYPERIF